MTSFGMGRIMRSACALSLVASSPEPWPVLRSSPPDSDGLVSGSQKLVRATTSVAAALVASLVLAPAALASVHTWGSNSGGLLGDGHTSSEQALSTSPVAVNLSGPNELAGGRDFSLALEGGSVYEWGNGTSLPSKEADVPTKVAGLSNIVQIAAGEETAYALNSEGKLYAWGNGEHGELGNGRLGLYSAANSETPVEVHVGNVDAIAASAQLAAAVLANGHVVEWGADRNILVPFAICSAAHPVETAIPEEVVGLSNVYTVAVGWGTLYALLESREVRACGNSWSGELGNGTTESGTTTPVTVSGLTHVTQLIGTGDAALALTESGEVLGWGFQYGATPVKQSGLGSVEAIAGTGAGINADHFIALVGGKPYTWFSNQEGLAGIGAEPTEWFEEVPHEVKVGEPVNIVAAGEQSDLVGAGSLPTPPTRGVHELAVVAPGGGSAPPAIQQGDPPIESQALPVQPKSGVDAVSGTHKKAAGHRRHKRRHHARSSRKRRKHQGRQARRRRRH